MSLKKIDPEVGYVFEFTLPGGHKFQTISGYGMYIAKRMNLVLTNLLKYDESYKGRADKVVKTYNNVLGVNRYAVLPDQLNFSLVMDYRMVRGVTVAELVHASLDAAKFNLATYKSIEDFQKYMDSLKAMEASPRAQHLMCLDPKRKVVKAAFGYDVYLKVKKSGVRLCTSVLTSFDDEVPLLGDYSSDKYKFIASSAVRDILEFKTGLEISHLFSVISMRYYLAQSGTMGNRISFDGAYGKVLERRNDALASSLLLKELTDGEKYEVLAISKTLTVRNGLSPATQRAVDSWDNHRILLRSSSIIALNQSTLPR